MQSRLASRLALLGDKPTVWQEFSPLAVQVGAINLGQGFPNWATPRFVKDAICRAVEQDFNQYTNSEGHPALRQQLAKKYGPSLVGRPLDWQTEVAVGVGSSESLFACMQALVNPGDEVLMLSPAFDIYAAQVILAGGTCRYVPLRLAPRPGAAAAGGGGEASPPEMAWTLDLDELRAALTPRTAVLLLNTPHNPTGKVFSRPELEAIARVLADFPRVTVVADEVYEHLVYDGRAHERMASLPGMWERTLTVSSAGKTFSCTGWKVGWVVGPQALVRGVVTTNQFVQFSVSTPAQQAIAWALEEAARPYEGFPTYYDWLAAEYTRKRDILMASLSSSGLRPVRPEGSFFIMADTTAVPGPLPPAYVGQSTPASGPVMTRDWALARYLTIERRVACIPPSAFYEDADKHLAAGLLRFAFCKEDESLREAGVRLAGLCDTGAAGTAPAGGH